MADPTVTQQQVSQILRDWSEIRLLEASVVIVAGVALTAAIKWSVPQLARRLPDRFRFWVLPWEPILRVILLLVLLAYVVPLFIYPTPENLLAISGALAVALGFAFKDYASSLIAGVVALYERPYRVGDWVTIDDTYGEVQSLGLRTVQILTPDDSLIAVPHGMMWSTAISNSNGGQRELMCVADFYLSPEHDGETIRDRLFDVALTSPYLRIDRRPIVVAVNRPWGTHFRLKAYPIDGRDQFAFVTDLTLRGQAMLRRLNVKTVVVPSVAGITP